MRESLLIQLAAAQLEQALSWASEFITRAVGQLVIAFAAVLEAQQHGGTTFLLGARQLGAVGRGEPDPQGIGRRPRHARDNDSSVSKNRHAEIVGRTDRFVCNIHLGPVSGLLANMNENVSS
jgi:hypothetical protein